MNVFDCAIKIEEEMKKYYKGLEAESHDPERKHLFSLLAASEEEHRNNLLRLKASMAAARTTLDGLDDSSCSYRPILTQRELLEESESDADLFRFMLREEENEIRFYRQLATVARDEATRRSLEMLAEEERRHLETMENIYEFVEAPKSYLAWVEFSNLREL